MTVDATRVASQFLKQAWKPTDGSGTGLFIRLPDELASQFPSLAPEDDSPPHVTFLYAGKEAIGDREEEFIEICSQALAAVPSPLKVKVGGLDYFNHAEKERRVAFARIDFSYPMGEVKAKLSQALMDAGFPIQDISPLVYNPHATLAYMDGLDSVWTGPVPEGKFEIDHIEVWGASKHYKIPLGRAQVAAEVLTEEEHTVLWACFHGGGGTTVSDYPRFGMWDLVGGGRFPERKEVRLPALRFLAKKGLLNLGQSTTYRQPVTLTKEGQRVAEGLFGSRTAKAASKEFSFGDSVQGSIEGMSGNELVNGLYVSTHPRNWNTVILVTDRGNGPMQVVVSKASLRKINRRMLPSLHQEAKKVRQKLRQVLDREKEQREQAEQATVGWEKRTDWEGLKARVLALAQRVAAVPQADVRRYSQLRSTLIRTYSDLDAKKFPPRGKGTWDERVGELDRMVTRALGKTASSLTLDEESVLKSVQGQHPALLEHFLMDRREIRAARSLIQKGYLYKSTVDTRQRNVGYSLTPKGWSYLDDLALGKTAALPLNDLNFGALNEEAHESLMDGINGTGLFPMTVDDLPLVPPPKNDSPQTQDELETLVRAQDDRESNRDFIEACDENGVDTFRQECVKRFGFEVPLSALRSITDQMDPLVLAVKAYYNRPRPFQLAKVAGLDFHPIASRTAGTPSYPSGHAAQAHMLALMLGEVYPQHGDDLRKLAQEVAWTRVEGGVHFPSDIHYGETIAGRLFEGKAYNPLLPRAISASQVFYHVTYPDNAARIMRQGFTPSVEGEWGPGVYLTEDPALVTGPRYQGLDLATVGVRVSAKLLPVQVGTNVPLSLLRSLYGRSEGAQEYERLGAAALFKGGSPNWEFLHSLVRDEGYKGLHLQGAGMGKSVLVFDARRAKPVAVYEGRSKTAGYYLQGLTRAEAAELKSDLKAHLGFPFSMKYWTTPKHATGQIMSNFTDFGDIARQRLNEQCQYISRYVDGRHGCPNLGQGLRFEGDPHNCHSLRIHVDDVEEFVRRVQNHRDPRCPKCQGPTQMGEKAPWQDAPWQDAPEPDLCDTCQGAAELEHEERLTQQSVTAAARAGRLDCI